MDSVPVTTLHRLIRIQVVFHHDILPRGCYEVPRLTDPLFLVLGGDRCDGVVKTLVTPDVSLVSLPRRDAGMGRIDF
jgi:hypothetical protein